MSAREEFVEAVRALGCMACVFAAVGVAAFAWGSDIGAAFLLLPLVPVLMCVAYALGKGLEF